MGRKINQDGTIYEGSFRFGLENGEGERVLFLADKESEHHRIELRQKGTF